MALINCKECGKEVSTEAMACPHCGSKQPQKSIWPKVLLWLAIAFVSFIGIGLMLSDSPEVSAKKFDQAKSECSTIGSQAGLNGIGSVETQVSNAFAVTKACMESRGFKTEFR